MMWLVKAIVLTACFLGFATAGFVAGVSRIKSSENELIVLDTRVSALELTADRSADRSAYEAAAKRKLGALMIQMDETAASQCKHDGPHFIAENSQGTYCLDCGAKLKD